MSHLKLVTSATSSDGTAYAEAIEDLDAGMCIVDRDGSVLASNQAFCRLLDLPPDWADPKANKMPIPASEQLVAGWLARVASQGGFAETVALSGRLIVQIVGKALPSGGVSLTLTETAEKSASATGSANQSVPQWLLHDAEENFRGVVENMADVYYHSDLQGNTTFGGPAIGRLLGYEPEEFEALDWRVLHVDPDRRAPFLEELERNGGQIRDFEAAFRHKNGETVWLSSNIRYRYGDDGELLGIEGVIRNITEQKSMQAALRESDAQLRAIIDNSSSVILLKGLDGRFQFAGKGFETAYGVPAEEVIGKTSHDITPGEFGDRVVEQDRRVIETGQAVQEELTAPFADGTEHALLISKFPVRDDAGDIVGVGGINTDITDRVEDRRALAESESRFRAMLAYSPDSVSLKDADGRFQIVNEKAAEVLGLSADEMIGQTIWDLLPEGDWYESDAADALLLTGEHEIVDDEMPVHIPGRGHRVLRRTKFPVLDSDAQPIGVGTITTDVTERKQAQDALRRSEAGLSNAQQLARMGNAERNFVTGENFWSDGIFKIFDIEKRSTVPDFDEIKAHIHPDDRVIYDDMLSAMYGGETSQKVDFRLISPSGEVRYVHELLEAYFGDDGDVTHCVAVIQDVTEAKLAEEALRKSEQRFHSMIDNLPSAVSLKDRDHRFILVNKSFETLYGCTKDSVVGEPLVSAMPENNDWESIIAADQEILDGVCAAYEEMLTLRFEDGEKRTFNLRKFPVTDDNGDISAVGTISTDITERLRAEERLRESEAKFHAIFDQAGLGIGLVGRDGDFIDVNNEMAEMFGLTRDEMVDESIRSLTVGDDLERSQEQFEALLSKKNDIARFEKSYLRKDGDPFEANLVSTTVFDEDGEFKFTVALIEDITERKKTEQALRESEELLRMVTDNLPNALTIKDEAGTFVFANPAVEKVFRRSPEKFIGTTAHPVSPDADWPAILLADKEILAGERKLSDEEVQFTLADGTKRIIQVTKFPLRDDTGRPTKVGTICTDITERFEAEEALRESEQWFRSVIDNVPATLTLKNPDGSFRYVNKQFREWYDLTLEQVIGHTGDELFPDETSDAVKALGKAVVETGDAVQAEVPVTFADGSAHTLLANKFLVCDDDGAVIGNGLVGYDVTESKRAELAMRESEARFRALVDNLPAGVILKDPDQNVLFINELIEEWYGLTLDQVAGRRFSDVTLHSPVNAATHEKVLQAQREVLDGGNAAELEVPLTFADGGDRDLQIIIFPVEGGDSGQINIGSVVFDVTDKKRAEMALRESEERFHAFVENFPACVTLKGPDKNIIFINGLAEEWFGVSLEQVAGKKYHEVTERSEDNAATHEKFMHAQQRAIDSGQAVEAEFPLKFADGSDHEIRTLYFPVERGDGEPSNIGNIIFDVTERRHTEEMLRQAQKMEAVGQLTGGVAHDFNNLLAVVIGNLEMVADHLQADTPAFNFVRNAFTAAERGASLTHQLLAFSRQQVLRPVNTDLAKLIADTKVLMSVSMGERITMELKTDDDLWLCQVDQAQLQNAILNLSINARDAMPSGGDVTISAENVTLDTEHAEAVELDAGDYVCLSVSDNGPGIPADVIDHVYEPFFTTKDVGEGSGLGLSMVYGFARQSGAGLEIETGEGEGTAVKIYFPAVVPDEPEAVENIADTQAQISEPDATILLVEDNAAFREITRAILESINFQVIDVGTVEEALAVIGDTTPFDLLLSDIGLPGDMDGHDLAQFAASARPGLKIILMSAHTDRAAGGAIFDGNVAAFLRKPHRKAALSQTLHRVLGLDS